MSIFVVVGKVPVAGGIDLRAGTCFVDTYYL